MSCHRRRLHRSRRSFDSGGRRCGHPAPRHGGLELRATSGILHPEGFHISFSPHTPWERGRSTSLNDPGAPLTMRDPLGVCCRRRSLDRCLIADRFNPLNTEAFPGISTSNSSGKVENDHELRPRSTLIIRQDGVETPTISWAIGHANSRSFTDLDVPRGNPLWPTGLDAGASLPFRTVKYGWPLSLSESPLTHPKAHSIAIQPVHRQSCDLSHKIRPFCLDADVASSKSLPRTRSDPSLTTKSLGARTGSIEPEESLRNVTRSDEDTVRHSNNKQDNVVSGQVVHNYRRPAAIAQPNRMSRRMKVPRAKMIVPNRTIQLGTDKEALEQGPSKKNRRVFNEDELWSDKDLINPKRLKNYVKPSLLETFHLYEDDELARFVLHKAVTAHASPGFQKSEWPAINAAAFVFASPDPVTHNHQAQIQGSHLSAQDPHTWREARRKKIRSTYACRFEEGRTLADLSQRNVNSGLRRFEEMIQICAEQRFKSDGYRCLANNKSGDRCGIKINLGSLEANGIISNLLTELKRTDFDQHRLICIDAMVKLASLAVCHWQRYSIWKSLSYSLPNNKTPRSLRMVSYTPDIANLSHSWKESERSLAFSNPLRMSQDSMAGQTEAGKFTLKSSARLLWHLPLYLPYHGFSAVDQNVAECVQYQARQKLFVPPPKRYGSSRYTDLSELDNGYIYVYWNRSSFGLTKIGCTTREVKTRIDEWEEKCQHIAEILYSSPMKIRHVARIEKLIHEEFRDYRVVEPICRGCRGAHIEWFKDLDLAFVIARIKVWSNWIMTEPYEINADGEWMLKPRWENLLLEMRGQTRQQIEPSGPKPPISPRKRQTRYDFRRRSGQKTN